MGIQGLLPLLKSIQHPISIAELSGNTVGVDTYCWLHKGAYGCALQLAEGIDSDVYVNYVMRRVNMMLYHNIKPILVFDGGHLPSKSDKEAERRNKRNECRILGLTHLQNGNRTQAFECFQKSIDITPEMAHKVIKACREKGVDCIVAPYEADAQLAYLMKTGIIQFIISEDSDLLVYGCEKVVFKMDANGCGILINLKNLPKLSNLRMDGFTEKKFREMCILSGCDYLPSVKGMGLMTAHKLLRKHSTVNKLIGTLRLNNKLTVPRDYEAKFARAEQTFLYQIVFDPASSKLVPLNPIPEGMDPSELQFAGHSGKWKQQDAVEIALGNLNPITGKRMGNIKVTKVISFDKPEGANRGTRKEISTTPASGKAKGPHPVLSSSGKYEAQKNLNGSFRETRSSEKTNTPFVAPVRTKRVRQETEESLWKGSRLTKLYSTTIDDKHSAERRLEATELEEGSSCMNQPRSQVRNRHFNPFRSPVITEKRPNEKVVSRYFGLAGMESIKNVIPDVDDHDTSSETQMSSQSSSSSALSSEDSLVVKERSEPELQESGYYSQTIDNSPPQDSFDQSDEVDTAPEHMGGLGTTSEQLGGVDTLVKTTDGVGITSKHLDEVYRMREKLSGLGTASKQLDDVDPMSKRLDEADSSQVSTTAAIPDFDKINLVDIEATSADCENCQPPKKKLKSNQTSLDRFAYVKNTTSNTYRNLKQNTSPSRIVLGEHFSQNCKPHECGFNICDEEEEDVVPKDGARIVKHDHDGELQYSAFKTRDKSETIVEFATKVQRKPIALRKKPTTGLGRCRSVGLGRPTSGDKKKSSPSSGDELSLFSYFAYHGRSSQIIS